MEFLLQPNVYSTGVSSNLLNLLDRMWLRDHVSGNGCLYIVSGFSNYNGGVRFYPSFVDHTRKGGKIIAIVGGSASQRLSSLQVAEALLNCGVDLYVVNRKRLVHAKCYGVADQRGEEIVVTSGNFTGPGMSQNAEAAVRIDQENVASMGFSWEALLDKMFHQGWDIYKLEQSDIIDKRNPGWTLLYDEVHDTVKLDDTQLVSMVVLLSHSDTARIQATPGTSASKGTQYFWLSKASFDFFPALTEKNKRGIKNTYFTCASYRKATKPCSSHQIRNVVVERLVLEQLKRVFAFAKNRENEFVKLMTQRSSAEHSWMMREYRKECDQAKARISQIDTIVQRLYEDNVSGKVSDDRYIKMSAGYETEQVELQARLAEIETILQEQKEQTAGVNAFLQIVRKYSEITELDATTIHEFVEKIRVFQATKDGAGHRMQHVKIYFNFIGEISVPEEFIDDEEETEENYIFENEETA